MLVDPISFRFDTVADLHHISDGDVTIGESATTSTTPKTGLKKSRLQHEKDLRARLTAEKAQHEAASRR